MALLEEAKARGIRTVSLSSTEMSRPMYEGLGFETSAHEMRFQLERLQLEKAPGNRQGPVR